MEDGGGGPTYAGAFLCIGPECEDACCSDWDIPLEKDLYAKYREFAGWRLGAEVAEFVTITGADGPESLYAQIGRRASGNCAFLGEDRLCGVQKEYGEGLLPATCSIFPRSLNRVSGRLEGSLSLSCPEAARKVLLEPGFVEAESDMYAGGFRTDNALRLMPHAVGGAYKPYGYFREIRAVLGELVRDRARPVWQRLFLVGVLCGRLQEVTATNEGEAVPTILTEYRAVVREGRLREELEGLEGDPRMKLEVVAAFTEDRLRTGVRSGRFGGTYGRFMEGVGGDAGRFVDARERWYGPFIARRPFFWERYLLNAMFQSLFPFGREGSADSTPQTMFDEYVSLATQFAWLEGLLVGVAGYFGEALTEAHVVEVVQSFTRAVEHAPGFRRWLSGEVKGRGLYSLEGMALLLKS